MEHITITALKQIYQRVEVIPKNNNQHNKYKLL